MSTETIVGVTEGTATVDVDADPGFFEMSPASAEQVTVQIRAVLERAWEYIAIAYQGRAYLALGYRSWDDYVDARLGDLRLTVPREQRSAVVHTLSQAHLSLRAIAKLLGVGVATVHRELAAGSAAAPYPVDPPEPALVQGRDGKQYRQHRRKPVAACPICGETHDQPGECPWDQLAQGIGPRATASVADAGGNEVNANTAIAELENLSPNESHTETIANPSNARVTRSLALAAGLLDEFRQIEDLVRDIEVHWPHAMVQDPNSEPDRSVYFLVKDLRTAASTLPELIERLQNLTSFDQ